jgi:hypothetical protein
MRKFAWLLLLSHRAVVVAACAAAGADLILFNGKIITVNDTFQIAQAVAVRGSPALAVGSNADVVPELAGPNTQRIDLRGKSMVPASSTTTRFRRRLDGLRGGMDTRKRC